MAVLLTRAGETVPSDVLIEGLWGGRGPPSAAKLLQVYVSQLRKALPTPARIETRTAGYTLELREGSLDAERFERMLDEGRAVIREGNPALAASLLHRALALWQGSPTTSSRAAKRNDSKSSGLPRPRHTSRRDSPSASTTSSSPSCRA